MSPERVFVTESLAALVAAPDYAALHQTFAERVTALVLDHGNLAEAWRIRNHQLLEAPMEDNQ